MKKKLLILGAIIFVFATLVCSVLGIYSFFATQSQTHNLQKIEKTIVAIEEWGGKNPGVILYTRADDIEGDTYEISGVLYDKFDVDAFTENFVSGKEYIITIDCDEATKDAEVLLVYGLADEQNEYLSSKDAISAENSNSIFGLVTGLLLLIGIAVLMIIIFKNKKSVVAFLREDL